MRSFEKGKNKLEIFDSAGRELPLTAVHTKLLSSQNAFNTQPYK